MIDKDIEEAVNAFSELVAKRIATAQNSMPIGGISGNTTPPPTNLVAVNDANRNEVWRLFAEQKAKDFCVLKGDSYHFMTW